jgi:predicted RNA binding protein YcfA (HicA-like mRNA interferase family)
MPKLKALNGKQVIKILTKIGFVIHHTKGSHYHLRHLVNTSLRIVVPFHGKELAPKTLKSIIEQSSLTAEEKGLFYN